jgi:hypothetical protein
MEQYQWADIDRDDRKNKTGPPAHFQRAPALRHGLSLPLRFDMVTLEKADAIARRLTRDQADEEKLTANRVRASAVGAAVTDPRGPREADGGGGPDVGQPRAAERKNRQLRQQGDDCVFRQNEPS